MSFRPGEFYKVSRFMRISGLWLSSSRDFQVSRGPKICKSQSSQPVTFRGASHGMLWISRFSKILRFPVAVCAEAAGKPKFSWRAEVPSRSLFTVFDRHRNLYGRGFCFIFFSFFFSFSSSYYWFLTDIHAACSWLEGFARPYDLPCAFDLIRWKCTLFCILRLYL